jgi:DNA-directed RNA polymerase subunit omega
MTLLFKELFMARITVEDCLEKVSNRFDLVILVAERARKIMTGVEQPKIEHAKDKATVIVLREIASGLVELDTLATFKQL